MNTPSRYGTASALRIALEARLKSLARSEGIDLQRLRRQVSFDRLLARLFHGPEVPWLLKGGYAMELRLRSARATKDIDLSVPDGGQGPVEILENLQDRAGAELGDGFVFVVGLPARELEGAPEGGFRFPVTASLGGRIFTKFHLDVGIGDCVVEPAEVVPGRDWMDFAGIPAARCLAIPKEQQFAEKLHAYTRRRERENSRVKDLVDMALLLKMGLPDGAKLKEAIHRTFGRRGDGDFPLDLPDPPESWKQPYAQLAMECGLEWPMEESIRAVATRLAEI
jgi:hypothetical protein